MKTFKIGSSIMYLFLLSLVIGFIWNSIFASYEYSKSYLNYWDLADKSSTIEAKSQYMNEFVSALEEGYKKGAFASNDAIIMKTPNNAFLPNLEAVKSLQERLIEISKMDPTSFQYNTAISQITSQEQGQAQDMLDTIKGCWLLGTHPMLWGWIGCISILLIVFFFVILTPVYFFILAE